MIVKNILLVLVATFLIGNSTMLLAQDGTEKSSSTKAYQGGRPDIPGVLGVDYGWIRVPDFPDEMKLKFFNTFAFSAFYKYDINIGDSHFSAHPGAGITAETYTFKENVTIQSILTPTNSYETTLVGLDSISTDENFKKSQMMPVYIDIPLEFTYRTNKEVPKRAFKVTLGAKVGFRIDNKTKLKYTQDGQAKRTKQKEKFDTSWYRFTLIARVGYGSINMFYNYSLTPIFEGTNGPLGTTAQGMSFGLSLDLF